MRVKLEEYDPRLMEIRLINGGWSYANLFSSNIYAIGNKSITLIDAGDGSESSSIISAFQNINLNIKNITNVIITHSHDDHWGGLIELLKEISLNIMVYKKDIEYYSRELNNLKGVNKYRILGLDDGDTIKTEGHSLLIIHTPGHDEGGICLYDKKNKILFSGDTVFSRGAIGSLRSGNIDDLKRSITRLATLEVDIMLPGHGDIVPKKANESIQLALKRIP